MKLNVRLNSGMIQKKKAPISRRAYMNLRDPTQKEKLDLAIADVRQRGVSIRKAAINRGISYSTLRDHVAAVSLVGSLPPTVRVRKLIGRPTQLSREDDQAIVIGLQVGLIF
jgi:hypothetical protein